MFRRALRLGSHVAVASTAAVVPVTAAACLSDSNTTYKCRNQQSPDAFIVERPSWRIDRSRIHDRHGSPAFQNLAETAELMH